MTDKTNTKPTLLNLFVVLVAISLMSLGKSAHGYFNWEPPESLNPENENVHIFWKVCIRNISMERVKKVQEQRDREIE